MANSNSKTVAPAALIVGAVAGAAAALLLSPKSGEENRKALKKHVKGMKAKLDKADLPGTVKDMLGNAQDSGTKLYVKARSELDSRLAEFSDYLDKKRYEQVIDDIIAKIKTKGQEAADKADDIRASLMDEWDDRKKQFVSKSKSA